MTTYNNHISGKSPEGKEALAKNEEAQRWQVPVLADSSHEKFGLNYSGLAQE
jgi:hypothetical protein